MGSRVITLLRFHLATAVPASLRALAPVAAAVTVGIMLQPTPPAAVIAIVVAVAGAVDLPLVNLLVVVSALALARAVGSRLAPRRDDWLGHLPAATAERRVAAAVAAALGPALAVAAVAILAAPVAAGGFEIRPLRLAGLIAVCLPAGAFGTLTRRSRLAGPAAIAAWLTLETGPAGVVIGPLAALVLVALARPEGHPRRLRALPLPPMLAITLRATGLRLLAGAASGALLAACAAVFATTNELPAWIVDRAAVLTSLLGIVIAATAPAEVIARRRPAWPWARALPWSARRRVLEDAALLAALATPAVLMGLAWRPTAALPVLLAAPPIVLAAAAAIRRQPGATFGANLDVLLAGSVAACWVAIVPAVAAAGPLAAWLALRWAVAREQRLSGVVLDPQLAFEAEEASR